MTVTDIKEFKNNRFEIYLNDEPAFVLYKSEINKYSIKTGAELSDDVIRDITDNVLIKRAKKRALNLLTKKDFTEKKLMDKLMEGGYSYEVAHDAAEYVKSYGYIDDAKYATGFIASRAESDSKNAIRRKLKERGVSDDVIDAAICEYYENDELNAGTERELIKRLILKKCKNTGMDVMLSDYDLKNKIIASLIRKGFSYGEIEKALRDIT